MNLLRVVVILWASTLLSACPTPASAAEPGLWEAARNPRLVPDAAALREAQDVYLQARAAGVFSPSGQDLLRASLHVLERADARRAPDPRVRTFYGRLLGMLGNDRRAIEVLEGVVAETAGGPSANDACFSLAISYARTGRPKDEIRIYDRWLRWEPDPAQRAVGYANQAEAFMVLGDVDRATQGYGRAIELAPDEALAHWGLAVALDRSGDHAGAIARALVALSYDPDARQLGGPEVFFVPSYDRFWYRALGVMARAPRVDDPSARVLWWERAVLLWQQYIDAARIDERWLPIARLRHAFSEQQLRRAQFDARQARRQRPTR